MGPSAAIINLGSDAPSDERTKARMKVFAVASARAKSTGAAK